MCLQFIDSSFRYFAIIRRDLQIMGQRISGVTGRGLTSNGYDTRRQLHPEELKEFLRPLYETLLQYIGYVAAVSLDADAVAKLHQVMQQKADFTGLDYLENPVSAKGFTLGLSLACVSLNPHFLPSALLSHLHKLRLTNPDILCEAVLPWQPH